MTKTVEVAVKRRYHYVELGSYGRGFGGRDSEKVVTEYETEWRGDPALVEVTASRRIGSDGVWSDWFVYASKASALREDGFAGAALSDTARKRLAGAALVEVEGYLADDALAEAFFDSYAREVAGLARSGRSGNVADNLRVAVGKLGDDVLRKADAERLLAAADAYDTFTALLSPKAG